MAKAEQTTAVATTATNAVATYNYGDDAGAGFEGVKSSDLSIPFLAVLQSNSPQVEANDPEGARAGMLYNTVTRELIDGTVNFLPVYKQDAHVEWVPRNKGGGFVEAHAEDSPVVKAALEKRADKFEKPTLENGNELVETHYLYGLLLDAEGKNSLGFCVIGFTSTKIKPYRDFLTSMYMVKGRPPMFAFRAQIGTVKQKNEKGSFFNFKIDPMNGANWAATLINPATEANLLEDARAFREMIISGKATAAYETQNASGTDSEQPSATPEQSAGKAPF